MNPINKCAGVDEHDWLEGYHGLAIHRSGRVAPMKLHVLAAGSLVNRVAGQPGRWSTGVTPLGDPDWLA